MPLEREPTLTTDAYSRTCIQLKTALIHVVMDPSEAIKIGPGACSRETKSASIEPPEQISVYALFSREAHAEQLDSRSGMTLDSIDPTAIFFQWPRLLTVGAAVTRPGDGHRGGDKTVTEVATR